MFCAHVLQVGLLAYRYKFAPPPGRPKSNQRLMQQVGGHVVAWYTRMYVLVCWAVQSQHASGQHVGQLRVLIASPDWTWISWAEGNLPAA